jgi:hypothetical protein
MRHATEAVPTVAHQCKRVAAHCLIVFIDAGSTNQPRCQSWVDVCCWDWHLSVFRRQADVAPAGNVRIYAFMGAQHYVGRSHTRAPYVNCVSITDHYLAMRALLVALDRWTNAAAPAPVSAYPSLHKGTLISVDAYRASFPRRIGLSPPDENLREPRLDFGPRFAGEGIADHVPPLQGAALRDPRPGSRWGRE